MNASGTAIFGGLLQGAGKALTTNYEERRQNALLALKRGWEKEDAAAATAAATSKDERDFDQQKELLGLGHEQKLEETAVSAREQRLTDSQKRAIDFSYDVKLEEVRAGLDIKKSAAEKKLAAEIDSGQIQSTRVGEKGELVKIYKSGKVEVDRGVKINLPSSEDEDESISSIRDRRKGGAQPQEKPAAENNGNAAQRAQVLARLGNAYAHAASSPQAKEEARRKYPGMFNPDGSLKPREELIRIVNQQFPG